MNTVSKLIGILVIAMFFLAGCFVGRRSVVEVRETVRIDTCFYEKPAPYRVLHRPIAVTVPRVIFAPNNATGNAASESIGTTSNLLDIPTGSTQDSVLVQIEMQTLIYKDSLYQATVSGPIIGGYAPSLDCIEIYATERVRTSIIREVPSWEVGPAAGVWMTSAERGFWGGIAARRNLGRLSLTATIGYDVSNSSPLVQAGITYNIWKKYRDSRKIYK